MFESIISKCLEVPLIVLILRINYPVRLAMNEDKRQSVKNNNLKHSVKGFAHEALHDLLHFDTKFFKTIPVLIFKPGTLTLKTFSAEQNHYVKPIVLFVFLNFLLFVFKSKGLFHYTLETYESQSFFKPFIFEKINHLNIKHEVFAAIFNTSMHFEQQEYLLIMIPPFALFLQLLFILKKVPFIENLTFTFHFFSFFIILLLAIPVVGTALQLLLSFFPFKINILNSEISLVIMLLLGNFWYLSVSLKKVYKQNWFWTTGKSLLLSASVILLIVYVFRFALFFIVMHAID